eukprot:6480795-Amphidinium_carterae.2
MRTCLDSLALAGLARANENSCGCWLWLGWRGRRCSLAMAALTPLSPIPAQSIASERKAKRIFLASLPCFVFTAAPVALSFVVSGGVLLGVGSVCACGLLRARAPCVGACACVRAVCGCVRVRARCVWVRARVCARSGPSAWVWVRARVSACVRFGPSARVWGCARGCARSGLRLGSASLGAGCLLSACRGRVFFGFAPCFRPRAACFWCLRSSWFARPRVLWGVVPRCRSPPRGVFLCVCCRRCACCASCGPSLACAAVRGPPRLRGLALLRRRLAGRLSLRACRACVSCLRVCACARLLGSFLCLVSGFLFVALRPSSPSLRRRGGVSGALPPTKASARIAAGACR